MIVVANLLTFVSDVTRPGHLFQLYISLNPESIHIQITFFVHRGSGINVTDVRYEKTSLHHPDEISQAHSLNGK